MQDYHQASPPRESSVREVECVDSDSWAFFLFIVIFDSLRLAPKAKERTMAVWALVVNYIATLLSPGIDTRFVGERWDLGFQI